MYSNYDFKYLYPNIKIAKFMILELNPALDKFLHIKLKFQIANKHKNYRKKAYKFLYAKIQNFLIQFNYYFYKLNVIFTQLNFNDLIKYVIINYSFYFNHIKCKDI